MSSAPEAPVCLGGVLFGPWERGTFAGLLETNLLLGDISIQGLFLKACKKYLG